jgi:hypothetical protein
MVCVQEIHQIHDGVRANNGVQRADLRSNIKVNTSVLIHTYDFIVNTAEFSVTHTHALQFL